MHVHIYITYTIICVNVYVHVYTAYLKEKRFLDPIGI